MRFLLAYLFRVSKNANPDAIIISQKKFYAHSFEKIGVRSIDRWGDRISSVAVFDIRSTVRNLCKSLLKSMGIALLLMRRLSVNQNTC